MDYKYLLNKKITIDDKEVFVRTIIKTTDFAGRDVYRINDEFSVNKFDLGIAYGLLKRKELENTSFLQKIYHKYRITYLFENEHDKNVVFKAEVGLRHFGFTKCGLFFNIRFIRTRLHLEFSWRDGDEYEKGRLPEDFGNFKRLF